MPRAVVETCILPLYVPGNSNGGAVRLSTRDFRLPRVAAED